MMYTGGCAEVLAAMSSSSGSRFWGCLRGGSVGGDDFIILFVAASHLRLEVIRNPGAEPSIVATLPALLQVRVSVRAGTPADHRRSFPTFRPVASSEASTVEAFQSIERGPRQEGNGALEGNLHLSPCIGALLERRGDAALQNHSDRLRDVVFHRSAGRPEDGLHRRLRRARGCDRTQSAIVSYRRGNEKSSN